MAEYVGFLILFNAPFEPDNLRILFTTLRAAVQENWASHRDALRWPCVGGEDLHVDKLLEATDPERMESLAAADRMLFTRGWISFGFGPVPMHCGLLTVGRSREGTLLGSLKVCDSEMFRDDSTRLEHRQKFDPGFEDPRFLPEPTLDSEDSDTVSKYIGRFDEVRQENDRRYQSCYRDHRGVWPVGAACLRNIFDRLAAALPVEESWVDEELSPSRDGGTRGV